MIEFEVADTEFSKELMEFWRESFLAAYGDIHSKENIAAYFSESYTMDEATRILSEDNFVCLKANRDKKTVGIAVVNHRLCPLKKDLEASELKHLYLLPSEYGSGLAQEMMDKVFERVKNEGKEYVWLSVSKLNNRAQRFYEKLGFELLGRGDDIYVGDEVLPSEIMLKRID
ncbi:GNAT family N-acetyltransferase [Ekhidna sp.]|uniref:GNAT family N-acetyltransferase n=1 Tax=Ekhidna sp. TaxID=2608089 RepID=UPI003299C825